MCEGRFFIQVKNILSGLDGWSSAVAALEGINDGAVTAETGREFKRRIVEGKKELL